MADDQDGNQIRRLVGVYDANGSVTGCTNDEEDRGREPRHDLALFFEVVA